MLLTVELGGERLQLECAAVSAVRYRARYGASVITHIEAAESREALEGVLLRLVHVMLPSGDGRALADLARLARRDGDFFAKGLLARDALLAPDPLRTGGEEGEEEFDEYQVLALMSAAELDFRTVYELPILHLAGVVWRCFELKDPGHKDYHEMSPKEMAKLYPR